MTGISFSNEVAGATITILVDNYSNAILKGQPGVERMDQHESVALAEHGFSALIELAGRGKAFLLDAGYTSQALLHNLEAMKVDPDIVDQVIISHGHLDHVAALVPFLREVGEPLPVWVAPGAFRERWTVRKDGRRIGPQQLPRGEWEAAGARIRLVEGTAQVADGCWITGPVPRRTDFEKGVPHAYYKEGGELIHDDIPDDQSVVLNVSGKGLVVISGCSHAGIVNILHYAREITGVDRVWAVLGGFHLTGARSSLIERTVQEVKALEPRMVAPMHCTGFEATELFAREIPQAFVLNSVGTRYRF